MEIESFEVSEGQEVTLKMADMPKIGVRTENTTVYIKGAPLGKPDEVSGTNQTIVFSARNAVSSGKISVKIQMGDGTILTATSQEDYVIPQPEEGEDKPFVSSISPPSGAPGALVTLIGNNLAHVNAVALQAGSAGYYTAPASQASEKSVKFRVPRTQLSASGTYPVYIRTEGESIMRRTSVRFTVEKQQG
jgi:hypothetical protein